MLLDSLMPQYEMANGLWSNYRHIGFTTANIVTTQTIIIKNIITG